MKKLLTLGLSMLLLGFMYVSVEAFTVESQSAKASTTQTFILLADPPTNSTALQMRLSVTGGTITGFSASTDGILSIGTCDNENTTFTTDAVCVDLASVVASFEKGEVLGVLTVERQDEFTQLKITKDSTNAYLDSTGDLIEDSGTAFTLYGGDNVVSKAQTSNNTGIALFFLFLAFLVGVVLGTTFTTLAHVLQHERLSNKKK